MTQTTDYLYSTNNYAIKELKEFSTPQELIDALDSAFLMTFYERHIERGTMSDAIADEVPENIAQAITQIIEMGGILSDGKTYIDFSKNAKRKNCAGHPSQFLSY